MVHDFCALAVVEEDRRLQLERIIHEHGEAGALRRLGLARKTVVKVRRGEKVRAGTRLAVEASLDAYLATAPKAAGG